MFSVICKTFQGCKASNTNFVLWFGCISDDFLWLRSVSGSRQAFHLKTIWVVVIWCGLLIVELAQSVTSCLEILMEPGCITTPDVENRDTFANLSWRLESYSRVQKLMQDFNEFFKWQVFLQMVVVVVHIYIFVCRPLKYWNKIGTGDAIAS